MIEGHRFKVCGLTTLGDAELAFKCGADFLGFILHPGSPRRILLAQFEAMASDLPARPKVAVSVEPEEDELEAMRRAGFDFFQIHFRHDIPAERIRAWSARVGPDRLWLAPKLPPGTDVAAAWLPFARTVLLDTYRADGFGGTGVAGDWLKFARHRAAHGGRTWILAGGLDPSNIAAALQQTGALVVDVNSGVESAPGVKDPGKLRAFAEALRFAGGAESL